MKRKDTVYYSLANLETRDKVIKMYNALTDSKRKIKEKVQIWNKHLYFRENNRAFLDQLLEIDNIHDIKLYMVLQIVMYTKNFAEKYTYDYTIIWLEQTEFLCKTELNLTEKEIYNVALKWCENFRENDLKEFNEEESDKKENNVDLKITLASFFENTSTYKLIMEVLVSKNLITENTYIWKDEQKGNKSLIASIIKYLHQQGYFKNKIPPTNEQIIEIVKNTFGKEIKIDTIKRAKPDSFDLSFITSDSIN